MFLSRVEIANPWQVLDSRLKDLTHLGAYHNWVERSFPEAVTQGERPRHLWRIDEQRGRRFLLVVSQEKPDLSRLNYYGVPGSARVKNYDDWLSHLQSDQQYRFRLTANPIKRLSENHKRVALTQPEECVKWLQRQGQKYGFILRGVQITRHDTPLLRRKNSQPTRLNRVVFDGQLAVTDPDKLRLAMTEGIGREKAYGMGLMTLMTIR